ncbi:MAG: hypothetical protein ABEJ94_06775 [Halorientalis sp.]
MSQTDTPTTHDRDSINPDKIQTPTLRKLTRALIENPAGRATTAGAAALLASIDATEVRSGEVKSQGRVSFGRSEAYRDGLAILIRADLAREIDAELWEWAEWQLRGDPEIAGEGYEPGSIREAARATAKTVYDAEAGGEDLGRAVTPAAQYLCNLAAAADTDSLQVRRGCRSEGRVYFDADAGDEAVGIWIPEDSIERITYDKTATASVIEAAYGEDRVPAAPEQARRGGRTQDPEKL